MKRSSVLLILFSGVAFILASLAFWSQGVLVPYGGTKLMLLLIVVPLLLPVYVYGVTRYPELRPAWKNPVVLLFSAFLIGSVVSAVLGVDVWNSFFGSLKRTSGVIVSLAAFLFFLYTYALLRADGKYVKRLFQVLIGVGVFVSLLSIGEMSGVLPSFAPAFLPDGRSASVFGNPIFFGSFLLLPLLISVLYALQSKPGTWRYVYGSSALLMFIGLWLSGARGALLGLIIGATVAALLFVLAKRVPGKKVVLGLGLVVIVLAAFVYVGRTSSNTHSFAYRATHLFDHSARDRVLLWSMGLQGFSDAPLLGVGPENYSYLANTHFDAEYYRYDATWPDAAHNMYLDTLLGKGLIGLVLQLALFVVVLRGFYLAHKHEVLEPLETVVFSGVFLALLVQAVFIFETATMSLLFALLFALGAALTDQTSGESASGKALSVIPAVGSGVVALGVLLFISIPYAGAYMLLDDARDGLRDRQVGNAETALIEAFDSRVVVDARPVVELSHDLVSLAAFAKDADPADVEPLFVQAKQYCDLALSRHVSSAQTHITCAKIQLAHDSWKGEGVSDEVFTQLTKAQELAPDRVEANIAHVHALLSEQDLVLAEEMIQEVVLRAPLHPEAYWLRGIVLHLLGEDPDGAAASAFRAMELELKLTNPQAAAWLIGHLSDRNELVKLVVVYKQLIRSNPTNIALRQSLAATYAALGDEAQARKAAEEVLIIDPSLKKGVEAFIENL